MTNRPNPDEEAEYPPTRVTFRATLPPIQSAIQLDGNGDGARIKLDVPRSDVGAILLMQQFFSEEEFEITIVRRGG